MNRENQIKELDIFLSKMKETIEKKGNDYANTDRLSNFKKVAQMTNTTPEKVVLMMMATKIARLSELLNKESGPEYESIFDSCLDTANYAFHLHCLKNNKNREPENGC